MKWLITFLFLFTLVQAEEITTNNLITNGNFETGNAMVGLHLEMYKY